MGSPYRTAPTTEAAQSPRDRGIVGDIIEQFADRFAFFRELIQNAIDADSPTVAVQLRYDETEALMRVRVADQGGGMDRDVIENRLLVLFRSTKEKDDTKIGKFGIGFASVLSIAPSVIRVDSVRDGRRHVLHLYPDLSYELFDAGGARNPGTAVEIEIPLAKDGVDDFVTASWESLSKWCRHATVPITLTAIDGAGTELVNERIDRPLELPSPLVQVRAASKDGKLNVVVGIFEGARPYAGFFNHGLTLFETYEPMLGRLAFKIQDARLGHTLSRDNVRRDSAFDRALRFTRHVAEKILPNSVASELRKAAESANRGPYRDIFQALRDTRIFLPKHSWVFPLVEPVGDRRSIDGASFGSHGGWCAGGSSVLTEGLARGGVPVVDLVAGAIKSEAAEFAGSLRSITGTEPRDVHAELVLIEPVEHTGSDLVLIERLELLLGLAYRKPSAIVFGRLTGAHSNRLSVAGGPNKARFASAKTDMSEPWVLDEKQALRNPFGLLGRSTLVLNTGIDPIANARDCAQTRPDLAAALVARLLLLRLDRLDLDCSLELFEHGLNRLSEGVS